MNMNKSCKMKQQEKPTQFIFMSKWVDFLILSKFLNQASKSNCYLNYQVNEQRAQQRQARVQEAAEKQLGIEKRLELEKAYKGMYHLMVLKMLNWSYFSEIHFVFKYSPYTKAFFRGLLT